MWGTDNTLPAFCCFLISHSWGVAPRSLVEGGALLFILSSTFVVYTDWLVKLFQTSGTCSRRGSSRCRHAAQYSEEPVDVPPELVWFTLFHLLDGCSVFIAARSVFITRKLRRSGPVRGKGCGDGGLVSRQSIRISPWFCLYYCDWPSQPLADATAALVSRVDERKRRKRCRGFEVQFHGGVGLIRTIQNHLSSISCSYSPTYPTCDISDH